MKIAGEASRVSFSDSQVEDVILQFSPGVIHVTARDFPNSSTPFYVSGGFPIADAGWYGSIDADRQGTAVINYRTLKADSYASSSGRFVSSESGPYELWMQLRFSPVTSELAIAIDGAEAASFPHGQGQNKACDGPRLVW